MRLLDYEHQSARRESEVALGAAGHELAAERRKNKRPEIRIEILEGFFNPGAYEGASLNADHTGWGPTCSEFLITLHLRLANMRPQRTSPTKCELFIESAGTLTPLTAVPVVLPHPHAIERDTIFHRGRGVERKTISDIQDLNMAIPLEYGVAVDGLVQFIVADLEISRRENDAFQDEAKFTVRVTDSFLQTHEVIRNPEPWPKKGRLVPALRPVF
jgi:hypothetical protein